MITNMQDGKSWDFRSSREKLLSNAYVKDGYIIAEADLCYLESMKSAIKNAFMEFILDRNRERVTLENAHQVVSNEESNDLRLYIMQKISKGTGFQSNYYNAAKHIIHDLCGNELAMQKDLACL